MATDRYYRTGKYTCPEPRAREHAISSRAELIVQGFVKDIFSLLASRFKLRCKGLKRSENHVFFFVFFGNHSTRTEPMVSEGLNLAPVGAFLPAQPKFPFRKKLRQGVENPHFGQY